MNAPLGFQHPQGYAFLFLFDCRKVVEVIGVVDNNCSISLHTFTAFSVASYSINILIRWSFVDAAGYNKLVEYMNGKFRQEIF